MGRARRRGNVRVHVRGQVLVNVNVSLSLNVKVNVGLCQMLLPVPRYTRRTHKYVDRKMRKNTP